MGFKCLSLFCRYHLPLEIFKRENILIKKKFLLFVRWSPPYSLNKELEFSLRKHSTCFKMFGCILYLKLLVYFLLLFSNSLFKMLCNFWVHVVFSTHVSSWRLLNSCKLNSFTSLVVTQTRILSAEKLPKQICVFLKQTWINLAIFFWDISCLIQRADNVGLSLKRKEDTKKAVCTTPGRSQFLVTSWLLYLRVFCSSELIIVVTCRALKWFNSMSCIQGYKDTLTLFYIAVISRGGRKWALNSECKTDKADFTY